MKEIVLTDPNRELVTLEYNGEYLILSFMGEVQDDFIVDNNYNIYMDGVKLDREDIW